MVPVRSPFKAAVLRPSSLWQRLLRRPLKENAALELATLLAARSIEDLTTSDVSDIVTRYKLTAAETRRVLLDTFATALSAFLQDDALSDEEVAYLASLRRLLSLNDDDAHRIERQTTHPRYSKRLEQVLQDSHISELERAALESLRQALRIPDDTARSLRSTPINGILRSALDRSVADHRFSDEERRHLEALAKSLGARLDGVERQRPQLARFSLFWKIENGELPEVPAPILLQRGEVCHFTTDTELLELRTVTRRINYHGPVLRIRIAKGLYYRVGSIAPSVVRDETLKKVDTGTLYLTSKRLIFVGQSKNTSIRLSKVLGFEVYKDGLKIEKDTGKSPHYLFQGDVEYAAVVLGAALARA